MSTDPPQDAHGPGHTSPDRQGPGYSFSILTEGSSTRISASTARMYGLMNRASFVKPIRDA
jgi:hypothetical protein